jgi:hypothetical protein
MIGSRTCRWSTRSPIPDVLGSTIRTGHECPGNRRPVTATDGIPVHIPVHICARRSADTADARRADHLAAGSQLLRCPNAVASRRTLRAAPLVHLRSRLARQRALLPQWDRWQRPCKQRRRADARVPRVAGLAPTTLRFPRCEESKAAGRTGILLRLVLRCRRRGAGRVNVSRPVDAGASIPVSSASSACLDSRAGRQLDRRARLGSTGAGPPVEVWAQIIPRIGHLADDNAPGNAQYRYGNSAHSPRRNRDERNSRDRPP